MKFLSDILARAGLVVDGTVTLNSVANATTDTDRFIVVDSGVVKYRTGTQLLSDIGGISGNQTITLSGDATGSGTTSIAVTLANSGVTAGTYGSSTAVPVITVDAKGRVTGVTTASISGSLTFTGDVTGSGTTGTTTTLTLANSGVTAGTYNNVTVNAKGLVTSGSNVSYLTSYTETDTLATVTGRGNTTTTRIGVTTSSPINFATSGNIGTWIGGIQDATTGWSISNNGLGLKADDNTYAGIVLATSNGLLYFGRTQGGVGTMASWLTVSNTLAAIFASSVTATSFIRSGGTSSQFLKADGSVDSTTYQSTSQKGQANGYASLDGAGKVPITQLPSSIMEYKGTWNASTNSPSLADGTGDTGDVYRVSTAGTRNLGSGSITFDVGDYVIYNGTIWEKSDTTDAVASVNGLTGVITLTTTNIGEGTNLYYTDARARAALSFTAGSGAYNSSTGVITIPTNTNQLTNGAGFITSSALSPYLLLAGGNMTGNIAFGSSGAGLTWAANTDGASITFESTGDGASGGRALSNLLIALTDNGDEGLKVTSASAELLYVNTNQFQYKGNNVWHAGNLTNLNQLTNGPGYITGNQTITLTGHVTGSGTTSIATTIANGVVTNAMLVNSSFNIGTTSISLGRASASQTLTGVSIDGTAAYLQNFYTTSDANSLWQAGVYTFFNGTNVPGGDFGMISIPTWGSTNSSSRYNLQIGSNIGGNPVFRTTDINGAGTWRTFWHSGNLTNLNQLTNGPGYLTAESDTLATVTNRGNSTVQTLFIDQTTGGGYVFRTSSAWGGWARHAFSIADGSNNILSTIGGYGGSGTSIAFMYIGKSYTDYSAAFNPDGNVEFRYDNSTRLTIDSVGISVSGRTTSGWGQFSSSTQGTPIVKAIQEDSSTGYYLFQGVTGSTEMFRVDRTGAAYFANKLSVGTTYAGFALNLAGTAYVIGGHVWVNDGYGYANATSVNTGLFPDSSHNIDFKSNNSSAIYINSSRNIGINTTSPVSKLEVYSNLNASTFTGITVTNGAGANTEQARAGIAFKGYDWVQSAIWHGRNTSAGLAGALVFGTNPDTTDLTVNGVVGRMWILNNGNVGIATSSPAYRFQVQGPSGDWAIYAKGSSTANNSYGLFIDAGTSAADSPFMVRSADGTTIFLRIQGGGNIGILTASPANKLQVGSVGSSGYAGNDLAIGNGTQVMAFYQSSTVSTWYTNTNFSLMPSGAGGVGNLAVGTSTASNRLTVSGSADITNALFVGYTTAEYGEKLRVNGGVTTYHAYTQSGTLSRVGNVSQLITTTAGGAGYYGGLTYTAFTGAHDNTFNGSVTIPNSVGAGGINATTSIRFGAANVTVTMTQSGSFRSYDGVSSAIAPSATATGGSISHVSAFHALAPYYVGSNTPTITNYFGLLLNDSAEYSTYVAITNRWGIYQHGSGDNNYFAGKVMVGTTTVPTQLMYVNGTSYFNGNMTVNGTITELSTINIKTNVETLDGALDKVEKMRGVSYNRKDNHKKEIGFIAEEVDEVYPEFVEYDEQGNPVGLHYARLTAVLLQSVKELSSRIKELEKRN